MTTTHQITLTLPEGADQFDAAVFTRVNPDATLRGRQ